MPYAWNLGGGLALVSGLAVLALGLVVLSLRPRRFGPSAFSAFAVLWGAQVVAAGLSSLATDPPTTLAWAFVLLALLMSVYIPLAAFLSAYPGSGEARFRSVPSLLVLAAPAVVGLMLLATAPGLFLEGAGLDARGFPTYGRGPLFTPVVFLGNVLVFGVALAVVARRLARAESDLARHKLTLLAAALLLYVSYRASDLVNAGLFDLEGLLARQGAANVALRLGVDLTLVVVVGGVLRLVAARRDLPWRDVLLGCALLPAAVGVLEGVLRAQGVAGFDTAGFWRLGMAATFAYAIGRYRLFDLEVRVAAAAPALTYAAVAFAGVMLLWGLTGPLLAAAPVLTAVAVVGLLAACTPALRLGHAAARFATSRSPPPELYRRKLEVYRSALEEAEARGAGADTERAFLSSLRRDLGITEREHEVLLLMLRRDPAKGPRAPHARFEELRELGRGAFGRAVLARDRVLQREVVLKQPLAPWVLDAHGRAMFLHEARLAAQANHPRVVSIFEILADSEPPVLVMEYLPGGSLQDLLDAQRKLPPDRVVALALEVLDGLDAIHRLGIVHRDLKPGNILLDADGRAKVTDFGVAQAPAPLHEFTLATGGVHPGSLAFMSPEQARGEPLDARSDLYAIGAVMYLALTGEHYVDLRGAPEPQARRLLLEAAPVLPHPSVPSSLEPVLARALAKDRTRRFESARAMAAALRLARAAAPASRAA